jgi:hypothetical protein
MILREQIRQLLTKGFEQPDPELVDKVYRKVNVMHVAMTLERVDAGMPLMALPTSITIPWVRDNLKEILDE